ncbi:MAG: tRNA (guanosine(37)-N1)-methyltransferase TrmD [Bacillota bacterium]|nr:tRNA (guanosine(37)-N1)-methyltransferase TrmD [Bacillota bacterium]
MMKISILTLFPEMFTPLDASMIKRAREHGVVEIEIVNIRDYAADKHATTDDRLYGGGAGMVLKPEPLAAAIRAAQGGNAARVLFTTPAGRPYDQRIAERLAGERHLIIVCGHYEGVDERLIETFADDCLSLGDFVLTGGEYAALAIADSVIRLLPGALGHEDAAKEESFSSGLLEYPQYTRPPLWEGLEVPAPLQSGNHAEIMAWRRHKSLERTLRYRPELLAEAPLTPEDAAYIAALKAAAAQPFKLYAALLHYPVYNKKRQLVNTSLTNLDLHDIARAAATYALGGYYIVQPLDNQRQLIQQLLDHWQDGFGARYNPDRKQALSLVRLLPQLADVLADIEARDGQPPRLIASGANLSADITGYRQMRELMRREGGSYLLLLGTGWGLAEELTQAADFRLRPIYGLSGFNHLSVRSAAAIIFDRLLAEY